MKINLYRIFFILILVIGCDSRKEFQFLEQIYVKENWNKDGILFLSESANVDKIIDDSLEFYVSKKEKLLALDSIGFPVDEQGEIIENIEYSKITPFDSIYKRKITFKNYGKVYNNENISIYTIYRTNLESKGRSHYYFLRTYDKQHKLIDSILFAIWDDDNSKYLSGELTKDLKVKILNKENKILSEYIIMENGHINEANKNNSM